MEGLAQELAGPAQPQSMPQGQGQGQGMPTVEQVIALLMEGAKPEELVQMGIPPELVMQAIEIIEQQMASQQPQGQGVQLPPQSAMPQEPGLAESFAG